MTYAPKNETPADRADRAGASRASCGGWSRCPDTVLASRVQWLIARHALTFEAAAIVAALAWEAHR